MEWVTNSSAIATQRVWVFSFASHKVRSHVCLWICVCLLFLFLFAAEVFVVNLVYIICYLVRLLSFYSLTHSFPFSLSPSLSLSVGCCLTYNKYTSVYGIHSVTNIHIYLNILYTIGFVFSLPWECESMNVCMGFLVVFCHKWSGRGVKESKSGCSSFLHPKQEERKSRK